MSHPFPAVTALALRLVTEAEAAGIEVGHAALSNFGVRLHPLDDALTPALAVELGLTQRHVMVNDSGTVVEFFDGVVDGIKVTTHHAGPAAVLAVEGGAS